MTGEQNAERFDDIRIPAELTAKVDQVFFDLKRNVLIRAAEHAATRANLDNANVVQSDDLAKSFEAVFTEALEGLNESFLQVNPRHVRRAS